MFGARPRCRSRFWTPEHGPDSWLTCARRDAHRGLHHAHGESWDAAEAMPNTVPPRANAPAVHAHSLPWARRAS